MSHKAWLRITALVIGVFGPVFTLGTLAATAEPARWTLDLLNWPLDGLQQYDTPTIHFLSALTGGFLVGWGVMVWCLQAWVYDHAPESVRRTVVTGVLAWFVFDSTGSILAGAPSNALINVLVLLLAIGPLWRPAKV